MNNLFLTNYTDQTFLDRIKDNLRRCTCFMFSVSFIKKAGLVLLIKDIDAALAFQWECENNISSRDLQALRLCKYVHLFIRKTKDEHGITQPFIYVGEGQFSNERKQEKLDSKTGKNIVWSC